MAVVWPDSYSLGLPEDVKRKYNSRGFYFDEDRELLDKIAKGGK